MNSKSKNRFIKDWYHQGFGRIGMPLCGELKGCPASHYMSCDAYSQQVNCWEIKKGCLCHTARDCEECLIYQRFQVLFEDD
jgi:hypothetical protein